MGAQQKAFLISMSVLVVGGFLMLREYWKGPATLPEMDEALARQSKDAMREQGRLQVCSRKPEWLRRVEKKWMAAGRLGNQKLRQANPSGEK